MKGRENKSTSRNPHYRGDKGESKKKQLIFKHAIISFMISNRVFWGGSVTSFQTTSDLFQCASLIFGENH